MGNGNSQGLPMGMFANQYRISEPSEANADAQLHGLPVSGLRLDSQKMPADVQPVLDHFKKVFGYDMTQLKSQQFMYVLSIIQKYEPIYENTDVVPTPDAFTRQVESLFPNMDGQGHANLISHSGIAYKYFYNETKPGEKSSKSASASSIMAGATADGGQSWSDWVASLFGANNVKSTTDTASAAGTSDSTAATPMATSAADYMTSVAPAGTPLPAVTTPGAAPTPGSASVTPSNPVPDMTSFQTNASNILQSTAVSATGSVGAPVPTPATPPVPIAPATS